MKRPLFQRHNNLDFSKPEVIQSFVTDTINSLELYQKELIVNREEQNLLGQRIRVMRDFLNDLPSFDPQYPILLTQIEMDQIELSELAVREVMLIKLLDPRSL
ncbi:MAG: hypothetical protein RL235_985 [Chlamydiota bacterium]